jgi:hypothetical protein
MGIVRNAANFSGSPSQRRENLCGFDKKPQENLGLAAAWALR